MDMSLIAGGFGGFSSAVSAWGQNQAAKITANAQNDIRKLNNVATQAANERDAVLTATQRWAQEQRNKAVGRNAEATQAANAMNFNRMRDMRTRQNFANNIRQAEEEGRQQAAAAASGVSGSVVDVINMTSTLRNGMANAARIEQEDQMVYDFETQSRAQVRAIMDQTDFTAIFDNPTILDAGRSVAQTQSVFGAALGGAGVAMLQFNATKGRQASSPTK